MLVFLRANRSFRGVFGFSDGDAKVCVRVNVGGCATCPGHDSSGAASRPGAAARLRIIAVLVPTLVPVPILNTYTAFSI